MKTNDNWLALLATACEKTSQAAVARQLRVSAAMINQALKGQYKGDLGRLERLVKAHFTDEHVICPLLHDISYLACLQHQARPLKYAAASPQKLALYRACHSGCSHFINTEVHDT